MGSLSIIHWIILGAVLLLFFGGKNKISDVMGDVAKGIKSFKKGLSDDDEPKVAEPRPVPRAAEPIRTLDHYGQAAPAPQPVVHAADAPSEPRKVG